MDNSPNIKKHRIVTECQLADYEFTVYETSDDMNGGNTSFTISQREIKSFLWLSQLMKQTINIYVGESGSPILLSNYAFDEQCMQSKDVLLKLIIATMAEEENNQIPRHPRYPKATNSLNSTSISNSYSSSYSRSRNLSKSQNLNINQRVIEEPNVDFDDDNDVIHGLFPPTSGNFNDFQLNDVSVTQNITQESKVSSDHGLLPRNIAQFEV